MSSAKQNLNTPSKRSVYHISMKKSDRMPIAGIHPEKLPTMTMIFPNRQAQTTDNIHHWRSLFIFMFIERILLIPGLEVIKLLSYSTQLIIKFQLLIKAK